MISDQTQLGLETSLIRLLNASDQTLLNASDQTILLKCPLISSKPDDCPDICASRYFPEPAVSFWKHVLCVRIEFHQRSFPSRTFSIWDLKTKIKSFLISPSEAISHIEGLQLTFWQNQEHLTEKVRYITCQKPPDTCEVFLVCPP